MDMVGNDFMSHYHEEEREDLEQKLKTSKWNFFIEPLPVERREWRVEKGFLLFCLHELLSSGSNFFSLTAEFLLLLLAL
jgi:hypothetical protein